MTIYDIAVSLIAAFLILKTLFSANLNGTIEIPGKVPGQLIGNIVLAVIIGLLVVLKRDMFNYPLIAPCSMAVFIGVSFVPKSGLSKSGVVCSGRKAPLKDMEFYAVEGETSESFRLRLHGFDREYVLLFKAERKGDVLCKMSENKIKEAVFTPRKSQND